MSYTTALVDGLAQLLATVTPVTYRLSGVYAADETGVTVGVMPDSPDRIVCLTPYPVEDTDLTDAVTAVQVRMRAGRDPRGAQEISDAVFAALHNRQHLELGGVYVALIWRQSEAWIGQDAQARMELSANYYLRTTRPGPHLNE